VHIDDGILPTEVWATGAAGAGLAVFASLRAWDGRRLPEVGVLTSLFFVASLVHIPVPPLRVHLQLTALVGIILGPAALPSILVALLFQYLAVGHGGLTTLGANTLIMGGGALVSWLVFRAFRPRPGHPTRAATAAFVATLAGFAVSGALYLGAMFAGGKSLGSFATTWFVAAYPALTVVEGIITAATVVFLLRVRPELVQRRRAPA